MTCDCDWDCEKKESLLHDFEMAQCNIYSAQVKGSTDFTSQYPRIHVIQDKLC